MINFEETQGSAGISVIIPALNEEKNIAKTLDAILRQNDPTPRQIIVVDNGSIDCTRALAEKMGALVIFAPHATIAELRNIGAQSAIYKTLAFIDADVSLDPDWASKLNSLISKKLGYNKLWITGSRCLPDKPENFFSKHWFSKLAASSQKDSSYINSGHLVTTRALFDQIKGFDGSLKTAEDVDFCLRGIQSGGGIFPEKSLLAFHRGYPVTAKDFIQREAWHGRQDFKSIRSALQSKIAIIALTNITAIVLSVTLALLKSSPSAIGIYLIFVTFLSFFISTKKLGFLPFKEALCSALVAFFYITGRSLSPTLKAKRHRAFQASDDEPKQEQEAQRS